MLSLSLGLETRVTPHSWFWWVVGVSWGEILSRLSRVMETTGFGRGGYHTSGPLGILFAP